MTLEGTVTLEISNTTPLPAKVYANEGICQLLFFQSDEVCDFSYADKSGKYQGQQHITPPRIDELGGDEPCDLTHPETVSTI